MDCNGEIQQIERWSKIEKSLQVVSNQDQLDNWTSWIMECRNSGMSIRTWCWKNGLKEKTYYYWQHRLFQELSARQDCPESSSLVDITPVQPVLSSGRISVTVRLGQAKPVLDAFLAWANIRNIAPKTALGKAPTYLKDQWPYLTNYLKDGRPKFSNNRAERSIKPFVIDRKNFLFANTPGSAVSSAVIFTIIQTAVENGLAPYLYLTWLLKTANCADPKDPDVIQSLLPWNAAAECRVK